MEPASDGTLSNKHNKRAAVRQEEHSQRITNQKKEDEGFEQFRKSQLDNFDASMNKVEKERQAEFAASMTALTAKQHQERVKLEIIHKGQLDRAQRKWEREKLEIYRDIKDQRARLEKKLLEEREQQRQRAATQGQQNLDGKRYVKDHRIGNRLFTDSVADTSPGKLTQQQSPSRLQLATQPNQVLNIPQNNHPSAPLESSPKRQRLQKVESILKPEENDPNDSPTKQLYNIPPYPSSGVSTQNILLQNRSTTFPPIHLLDCQSHSILLRNHSTAVPHTSDPDQEAHNTRLHSRSTSVPIHRLDLQSYNSGKPRPSDSTQA